MCGSPDSLSKASPSIHAARWRKSAPVYLALASGTFFQLSGVYFSALSELETLDGRRSEAEVRQSVFYYIEAYYSRIRMHSALDNVAPNGFYLSNVA